MRLMAHMTLTLPAPCSLPHALPAPCCSATQGLTALLTGSHENGPRPLWKSERRKTRSMMMKSKSKSTAAQCGICAISREIIPGRVRVQSE
jgi:hypothetical protein